MKLVNIQTDILKANLSLRGSKGINYAIDKNKGIIFCTLDRFVGYFIKQADFKLDIDKLEGSARQDIKYFYPDTTVIKPATKENISKIVTLDGEEVNATKIGNKWINVKLLKYFDKDATFETNPDTTKALVYVYENGELAGLVCPIRMPSEEV